jgi:hypothetical protein
MMAQSKGKKTTTINIDKINGIENENEIGGFGFTDEMKVRFINGYSESLKPFTSFGIANLTEGLSLSVFPSISQRLQEISTAITPEIQENFRLFGEYMREKQAIEVDRYHSKAHKVMMEEYTLDYSLLTEKEKRDFFNFVVYGSFTKDERWKLPFYSFLTSITDREWQDCGMKYYALQKKKSKDAVEEFEKQLSTTPPARKGIEAGKDTPEKVPYKKEKDIMEELDKFRKAVTDICLKIKGLSNDKIPTIAKIKDDALKDSGLTERVVTSNIKKSITLTKTGLPAETTTGHIRQIVGQFFKGNDVILRKLKLNA